MPKMPVTASIAASRPMTPSATVAARAGNNSSASASGQLCTVMGTFGAMPLRVRSSAAAISLGVRRERTTKTRFVWLALRQRQIHDRLRRLLQVVVFAVFRHAHHFRQVALQNKVLSDRRRFAPHLAREGLVHDGHIGRLCGVVPRDIPPASAAGCRPPPGIPATSETRRAPAQNCSA